MEYYVVGEDQVTLAIAKRIISHCHGTLPSSTISLPARGSSSILKNLAKYNNLAKQSFVAVIVDLDHEPCVLQAMRKYLEKGIHNPGFALSFAVTESEAWIMADRVGFSKYFEVDIELIPIPKAMSSRLRPYDVELGFPAKPSFCLVNNIAPRSSNTKIRQGLGSQDGRSKGSEYNLYLLPFIENHWDLEKASINSYSLKKAINRICKTLKALDEVEASI